MKIKNGEKWNNKVIAKLIFSVGSKTFNDTNALSEHKTIEYHWRWLKSLESRNQLSRKKNVEFTKSKLIQFSMKNSWRCIDYNSHKIIGICQVCMTGPSIYSKTQNSWLWKIEDNLPLTKSQKNCCLNFLAFQEFVAWNHTSILFPKLKVFIQTRRSLTSFRIS